MSKKTELPFEVKIKDSQLQMGRETHDLIIDQKWGEYPSYKGLRWHAFAYAGINAEKEDGALGELRPGARTPVELVANDSVFWDIPLSGKLTLLSLDPQGNIFVDSFDGSKDKTSYAYVLEKGCIFCWFADKNQNAPATFLETEKPGFKDGDLPIISYGITTFNGHKIPPEFWEKFREIKGE